MLRRLVACVLFSLTLGAGLPSLVGAQQLLGTFRWQLAPFCNVITVSVTQMVGAFTLDGFDDQCGAATRAAVVGTALPNPDGSIGVGLSRVATPGAAPVHIDVALALATLGGPWHDSAGNTGTFAFDPATPAAGAPRPATGGLISTVTPGAGLVGGGTTGAVSLGVAYGGTGSALTVARSDHTHAALGTNNTAVGLAALSSNAAGSDNTAAGARALDSLSSRDFNSAFGAETLVALTSGQLNTAVGAGALFSATTGGFNTAVGPFALSLATGSRNVGIGVDAGVNLTGGSNNIYIGSVGPAAPDGESGRIRIGTGATQTDTFSSPAFTVRPSAPVRICQCSSTPQASWEQPRHRRGSRKTFARSMIAAAQC